MKTLITTYVIILFVIVLNGCSSRAYENTIFTGQDSLTVEDFIKNNAAGVQSNNSLITYIYQDNNTPATVDIYVHYVSAGTDIFNNVSNGVPKTLKGTIAYITISTNTRQDIPFCDHIDDSVPQLNYVQHFTECDPQLDNLSVTCVEVKSNTSGDTTIVD